MYSALKDIVSNYTLDDTTPGFAALIQHGDQPFYSVSIGIRNASGDPITMDSNFRLASISKQFTAVSILQLIEKGTLSFSTTLREIFLHFPAYGEGINIHHLLTHTSGLKDYEDQLDSITTLQISDGQVLELACQESGPSFAPGSSFHYSNGAYCLLALIVAKASGMPFDAYLKEKIFTPAGMRNSFLNTAPEISERVFGFTRPATNSWQASDQNKTSATQGDGGIYSSLRELALWQKSLYEDKKVLSQESLALMTTPHVVAENLQGSYGYGIIITKVADQLCYRHGGESVGFSNAAFYFPEAQTSLSIMSNINGINMVEVGKNIAATAKLQSTNPTAMARGEASYRY